MVAGGHQSGQDGRVRTGVEAVRILLSLRSASSSLTLPSVTISLISASALAYSKREMTLAASASDPSMRFLIPSYLASACSRVTSPASTAASDTVLETYPVELLSLDCAPGDPPAHLSEADISVFTTYLALCDHPINPLLGTRVLFASEGPGLSSLTRPLHASPSRCARSRPW